MSKRIQRTLSKKEKKEEKKLQKAQKKSQKKYKISKEKYDQFLVFKLMKGRNLAVRDVSGKSDPYVMLSIGKEQQYKSRIIKQNLNPVWNEIYVFGLKNLNTKVKLECWDWDRLSSDDEMGDKIINLSNEELKSGITATKWINLENVESGKIHISLTYYKIEGKKLVTEFDYQKEKKIGQVLRDKGLKVSMKQKKMISSRLSSLEKGTDLSGLTSVDPENPILTNQNASGQLDLEFIYGYRGQEGRTNIHFINLNEITYYASSIGIVLNTRTKKQRFFIGHHTGRIFCNDVHPNKKIVATAEETDQGKICLWSAETCELLATVDSPHNKGVMSIRFSNDGRRLLTVGMDENSTVCYWDITQNGKIVLLSKDSTSSSKILNCCFLYNDHTKFVTCGLKNLHFWEAQNNGSTLSKTPVSWGGNEPSLLLTIDATSDNHIITGSREGNIMIWSWSSRSEVERFRAHTGPCMTLKVKHEDGLIISGGKDGKINLWNASTFQREKRINSIVGGPIRAVDFIKGTAIVGTNKNQIWFTENVNSDKSSMLIFSHAEEIHGLTSHPTTQNFITGSDDRSVRVFSISSHKVINKKSINGQARCLAYSPNGKLISIGLRDGEILIVDSKLQQLSNKKEATSPPIKMLWAPNSSMLLISYHDGYLDIYNASSVFRRTTKIQLMAPSVFIDWSVDSKYFRVLENNQIVVYESEKGTKVTNLQEQIQWNSSSCEIAKEGNITTCLDSIHNWISYGKQNVLNVEHSPLNSSQPTVYRGHSVLVANLMYIQDKYLITVGGPDMCIFQWKII
ncbi:wd40 repeat [Anaeramoeba flamelloides]|uniref:Wd40 repeat n=1 Tax=Anaeramoeba flamelloides TaxID=1746091 RepID=A0AAV7ZEE4_9EUKA|nr:wd40 repeat [Anaeramoeba flamelloides]